MQTSIPRTVEISGNTMNMPSTFRNLLGAGLAAFLWIAIGTAQEPPQQQQVEQKEAPRPAPPKPELLEMDPAKATTPAEPVDPKSYIIGPEDVIGIRVWREPELSGYMMVRPDGRITLPLVGEVQAGGKTPDQLKEKMKEELAKFVNSPEVMVVVQQVRSKKFYITGMAHRTGVFPLVVPITILEALSAAGGVHEYANKKKIVIVRGTKRILFNYKDVIRGKNLQQNIYLENGDHIIIE